MSIPYSFFKQRCVSVNYVIMKKLYSPDKMVGNFYQFFLSRKQ